MGVTRSSAALLAALALLVSAAGANAVPRADLAALGDEFADSAALSGWSATTGEVTLGRTTFGVAGGVLTVHAGRSAWFRTQHAFALTKPVTGDFVATVRVRVRGEHGPVPTANWSLAGLLVRAPGRTFDRESWLNLSLGRVAGSSVFERKTTQAGNSILELAPAPESGWVELRQVRVGSRFFLLYRPDGDAWRLFWRYHRGDLPRTLAVGPDAQTGTDDDHADLVADFDYVHFASTGLPGRLRARIVRGAAPLRRVLPYLTR